VAKAIRTSLISRCLIVAVTLLSWLVVTNHCALGQIQGASAAHAHCHAAKGDQGKKTPGDGMRECCRAIKASLTGTSSVGFEVSQFRLQAYSFHQAIAAPVLNPRRGILLDHGPPRAVSFAEIVLQQSLLSHAPPALA
jgi:hypothetical protein